MLYNMKCHFPIFKTYLDSLQTSIKKQETLLHSKLSQTTSQAITPPPSHSTPLSIETPQPLNPTPETIDETLQPISDSTEDPSTSQPLIISTPQQLNISTPQQLNSSTPQQLNTSTPGVQEITPAVSEPQKMDDVVCQICNSGEVEDKNQIVYCSLCNITVHQNCYALTSIPQSDFICDLCRAYGPKGKLVRCPFCPCRGGALRPTRCPSTTSSFDRKNPGFAAFLRSGAPDPADFWPLGYAKFLQDLKGGETCAQGLTPAYLARFSVVKEAPPSPKHVKIAKPSKKRSRNYRRRQPTNPSSRQHLNDSTPQPLNTSTPQPLNASPAGEECEPIEPPVEDPVYDFYRESFVFTPEELREEPIPSQIWAHMSCMYWLPWIQVRPSTRGFEARNVLSVPRERFGGQCELCGSVGGATVECSHDGCSISLHPECGRRARVHLFLAPGGAHIAFCAAHTPLLSRNAICTAERREKAEILDFTRKIRRFLKARGVVLRPPRAVLSEEDEIVEFATPAEPPCQARKSVREIHAFDPTPLLKFVEFLPRRVLSKIKIALQSEKDFFDRVNLLRKGEEFRVASFVPAKKNFLEAKLSRNSSAIALAAENLAMPLSFVFTQYSRAFATIKALRSAELPEPPLAAPVALPCQEEPLPPSQDEGGETDSEVHCLCRRPWAGELMLECDRCEGWFHPLCIGVRPLPEAEIQNYYVLCPPCRTQFALDYKGCESLVNPEIYI